MESGLQGRRPLECLLIDACEVSPGGMTGTYEAEGEEEEERASPSVA